MSLDETYLKLSGVSTYTIVFITLLKIHKPRFYQPSVTVWAGLPTKDVIKVVHNPAILIPLLEENGNPATFVVIRVIF